MISLIIPTLNEELYLPPLLDSIERQEGPLEVIVIDGNSEDKTCDVVKEYQRRSKHEVKLIELKRRGLSFQRNTAVDQAKYDRLLFLDADVILPKDFISASLKKINAKNITLAGTKIYATEPGAFYKILYWNYSNFYLPLLRLFNPVLHGCSIFITKELHYKIGGFDDGVTFEDFMYTRKAAKYTKSVLLKGVYVRTSARRYYSPSTREVFELLLSGLYSNFKAGMQGQSFMKKFHENYGKHGAPQYSSEKNADV